MSPKGEEARPRASDIHREGSPVSASEGIAAYVDHAAPLVGLTLTPEQREGVIRNLAGTFAVARLVMEFPLPDEVDAAPVFEP
ncbi:MAG: DUF4089 domain-containing protein [Candidatus Rokubacteria bacterium]|nr:DUF4089 domain-containing protein [Candidatus Rokubacteria bacterium]